MAFQTSKSDKYPVVETRWPVLIAVLALVAASLYVLLMQSSAPVVQGSRERVRIGVAMHPSASLTFVALENGYFDALGLEVVVKKYPSGKRALLEGLFPGEVDLTSAADVPVAMAGLSRKAFRILTSTFSADNVNRVIARRDRGITSPKDLKGKTAATQRASAVHFFLHLFLLDHGMSEQDITLRYMKAEFLPQALADGDIDAFSMREPYISQARDLLGDNAVVFAAPGLYAQTEALVGSPAFIDAKPQVIDKVLSALLKAETFIYENPDASIEIASRWIDVSKDEMAQIWPTVSFRMGLNQELLLLLENEARWAMESEISTAGQVPYYLDFIDTAPLKKAKPRGVTVIK